MTKTITANQLTNGYIPTTDFTRSLIALGYKRVKTSAFRGYVSRKNNTEIIEEYNGHYGKGYTVKTARWDTTNFCWITYFVKGDN